MRVYANLIQKNLALFDLPTKKYNRISIFQELIIQDRLADDDFEGVTQEVGKILSLPNPAFSVLFNNDFEKYISLNRHHARWQKIKKDYNHYTEWEIKRRNKENPYFTEKHDVVEEWESLPDFAKQKRNRPYQFDLLYREVQTLAGMLYELTKDYKTFADKDLFRAKVNSLMVPNKIILALNGNENSHDLIQSKITVVNIKLSLDAYKLAYLFINNLIDSLNKLKWSYSNASESLSKAASLAIQAEKKIKDRILNLEKAFILYLEADFEEES